MVEKSTSQANQTAQGNRQAVIAVFLVLFLAAIDGTVISTLLPTITDKLGDRYLYPWIMSGFLLPLALIAPLSGALADRFGALRILVIGILLFLSASVAAALSPDLPWLIAARVGQGAGAGMIIVLSYTMLAIVYGPEQRGRMQGILSGVWGLAAIAGPLVGAGLNAALGWRWVFWFNLPIGLLGLTLLSRAKFLKKMGKGTQIASVSQLLFAVAVCGGLLLLSDAGRNTVSHIGLVAGGIGFLAFLRLYFIVRNAPESSPVPIAFFQRRDLSAVIALVLLSSAGLYASVTLLPFSLHEAQRLSTLSIGFFIMVAALGWVVGSAICGGALKKFGYRQPTLLGAAMLVAGASGLALAITDASLVLVGLSELLIGLGMGFVATATLVLCQNAAPPEHIGSYTSTVQLLRNLGAALGVNALATVTLIYGGAGSYPTGFTVLAGLMVLSLPLALLLPSDYDCWPRRLAVSCVSNEQEGSEVP